MRSARGFELVFVALLLACNSQPEKGTAPDENARRDRFVTAARWDTVWMVGGTLQDTLLAQPEHIKLDRGNQRLVVFDMALNKLFSFNMDTGHLIWNTGHKGSGPGEYENVLDLDLDSWGFTYLYDSGLKRLTIIDTTGEVEEVHDLSRLSAVRQILSIENGILLVTLNSYVPFLVEYDLTRQVIRDRTEVTPWKNSERPPLINRGIAERTGLGKEWIFASMYDPAWFQYNGHEKVSEYEYWESIEPPIVEVTDTGDGVTHGFENGRPTVSALDLSISDTLAYVLFGGTSEQAYGWIDRFSLESGEYRGSYLLPGRSVGIEVDSSRNLILVTTWTPYPAVVALTPRDTLPFSRARTR